MFLRVLVLFISRIIENKMIKSVLSVEMISEILHHIKAIPMKSPMIVIYQPGSEEADKYSMN